MSVWWSDSELVEKLRWWGTTDAEIKLPSGENLELSKIDSLFFFSSSFFRSLTKKTKQKKQPKKKSTFPVLSASFVFSPLHT